MRQLTAGMRVAAALPPLLLLCHRFSHLATHAAVSKRGMPSSHSACTLSLTGRPIDILFTKLNWQHTSLHSHPLRQCSPHTPRPANTALHVAAGRTLR